MRQIKRRLPCKVQDWRRQAFFALSNSTQVLLEPQRSVLPGAPITAPAGASNGRYSEDSARSRARACWYEGLVLAGLLL
jgi:hypothetical protein